MTMFQALNSAMLFLLGLAFDIYLFVVILRILLPLAGADYYNPVCQLVNTLTNPILKPIQKILPSMLPHYIPAIFLLFVIEILRLFILMQFTDTLSLSGIDIILVMLADIMSKFIAVLFYAIIIRIIWSWINPLTHHPLRDIIYLITDPILTPISTRINPISGIDFSPFIALVLLQLVLIIFVYPVLY